MRDEVETLTLGVARLGDRHVAGCTGYAAAFRQLPGSQPILSMY
jgi:hypothetical protein